MFGKLPLVSCWVLYYIDLCFNPYLKYKFLFIRWHLGSCKKEYLPNQRGFDTFFGYWSAAEVSNSVKVCTCTKDYNSAIFQDYFTKTLNDPQGVFDGVYDFHLNEDIFKDTNNSYSLV